MIFEKEIILYTDISSKLVVERLKEKTDKHRLFRAEKNLHYKFEGIINEDNFQISRIFFGRYSFTPMIYGSILEINQGAKLCLNFKLNSFVKYYLITTILIWIILGSAIAFIFNKFDENFLLKYWMIPIPIIVIITIGILTFNKECKKSTKIINELIVKRNANKS